MPARMSTTEHSPASGKGTRRFSPTELVGRVLGGRWTIVRALGEGGTATVYEAVHRNGRHAAVKILHAELASNPSVRRRFQSEGYAANRVQHPNVVAVLDDGEEADGTVYLVMELLKGRSLAACLSEGVAFTPESVASVAIAVLDVLAAAHDNGVVHRDIKPANVFQTVEGRIKLLDFGAARVGELANDSAITQSGATVGTPAFMAPEQAAGRSEEVDALTDIWAVGATMFQLLTQRLVHDASSSVGAVFAAATAPAPLLRTVAPDLPTELSTVVDRALAFQRSERWPNARAMRQALERASPRAAAETAVERRSTETEPEVAHYYPSRRAPVSTRPAKATFLMMLGLVAVGLFAGWRAIASASRVDRTATSRRAPAKMPFTHEEPPPVASNGLEISGLASGAPVTREVRAPSMPVREVRAPRIPTPLASRSAKDALHAQTVVSAPAEPEEALLERRK